MKNILLLHPSLLFYKIPIYNKLSEELARNGYRLIIWFTDIQTKQEKVRFQNLGELKINLKTYFRILNEHKIDYVINILFKMF